MVEHVQKIGIVAPARRLEESVAKSVAELAARHFPGSFELDFHLQCFRQAGHFAGVDEERAAALIEYANRPDVDVIWFARGGYGSIRIVDEVLPKLGPLARQKVFIGYSDLGSVLGALYANGFAHVVHGPMPADVLRDGGDASVVRVLEYLTGRSRNSLEPHAQAGERCAAFNLTTLSRLIGTPHFPDLSGHVVMLEEVSEYMYNIDRTLAHLTSYLPFRKVAGVRLGRCSLIPANDPDFGQTEVEVAQHWCSKRGIAYLGRADIGHDIDNKIVPFGASLLA